MTDGYISYNNNLQRDQINKRNLYFQIIFLDSADTITYFEITQKIIDVSIHYAIYICDCCHVAAWHSSRQLCSFGSSRKNTLSHNTYPLALFRIEHGIVIKSTYLKMNKDMRTKRKKFCGGRGKSFLSQLAYGSLDLGSPHFKVPICA